MPGATPSRRTLPTLGFFAAALLASTLSALLATPSLHGWYPTLHQPPLSPPAWLFAPVWTILYLLTAWAASLAFATRPSSCRTGSLRMWGVQLIIHFAWTLVFFRMRAPGFALIDILLLLIATLQTMRPFHTIRPLAAWLLAPCLAWTLFAAYLNAGIVLLNR